MILKGLSIRCLYRMQYQTHLINIKTIRDIVKNIKAIGLVFLLNHESDFISLSQRFEISCISTISCSSNLRAVSLSCGVNSWSLSIRFLTTPSTPWSGNILVITSIIPDLPSKNLSYFSVFKFLFRFRHYLAFLYCFFFIRKVFSSFFHFRSWIFFSLPVNAFIIIV